MKSAVRQAGKFTVVGMAATAVHVAAALAVHAVWGLSPLWSNAVAFLVALGISYAGNWFWTFEAVSGHRFAAPRFLAVALLGFGINHAMVFVITGLLAKPLWVAMVPVFFVVPVLSFWLNKTRVFLAKGLHA